MQIAALCAAFYSFEKNPYITQVIYLDNLGDGVDSRLSERDGQPLTALVHGRSRLYGLGKAVYRHQRLVEGDPLGWHLLKTGLLRRLFWWSQQRV